MNFCVSNWMCHNFGNKPEMSLFRLINSVILAHKIGFTIRIILKNNISEKVQFKC